ncbi:DUF4012 domain-containing protein [Microbacterium profundi]|uniref:DUF4012 domain-containing protein n=1 Tax=Microbacterium profundi TaxID=450380 RepID=UPI00051A2EBF|nr:DUF4012 domain-containing protein [Microbacterium profundi]
MTTRAELRAEKSRRPLLRSFRFWIPVGLLLLLLVLAVAGLLIGKPIYDRAMSARSSLEQAIPLATTAKDQILAGDSEGAKATAAQLATLTADAREQTDDGMWKSLEWVPFVGPNLHAVRTAAVVTDDLVTGALTPATNLSLKALTPVDGAINIAAITDMQTAVTQAADAVDKAATDLDGIDREALIPQVGGALTQLTDAVDEMQPLLGPAKDIIGVLPAALGADGPRNYLTIFQNNAESRGTGGNPAAIVMLTADQGKISITQQASSADFNNGRETPIIDLDPETVAIYGDKIGRYVQDTTMSPEFSETAEIIRAFWAESFGTPVDAVVSFDPVALSYLLKATGPVTVPAEVDVDGYTVQIVDQPVELTADNAVPYLLNQVYSEIKEPVLQDAFFAMAAGTIFDAVTSGSADPKALLTSLTEAIDEGRLMYVPSDPAEAELVGDTRLSGTLPSTNESETLLGVYINDITEGKLDYYMQLDIAASSTQCESDSPVFSTTATLANMLKPADVDGLANYISPGRFFPKGVVSTDLVIYGPVGATLSSVTVDGTAVNAPTFTHMGRPAVKVNIENPPSAAHSVTAEFTAAEGEYGPLSVRHTPMVRDVPLVLDSPDCPAS